MKALDPSYRRRGQRCAGGRWYGSAGKSLRRAQLALDHDRDGLHDCDRSRRTTRLICRHSGAQDHRPGYLRGRSNVRCPSYPALRQERSQLRPKDVGRTAALTIYLEYSASVSVRHHPGTVPGTADFERGETARRGLTAVQQLAFQHGPPAHSTASEHQSTPSSHYRSARTETVIFFTFTRME